MTEQNRGWPSQQNHSINTSGTESGSKPKEPLLQVQYQLLSTRTPEAAVHIYRETPLGETGLVIIHNNS